MWTVEFESLKVQKEVEAMIAKKELLDSDQEMISTWVRQVTFHGPESLGPQWNDHALQGTWHGYRASCFSNAGRIIYRIYRNTIQIKIVRITTTHDYRRR